MASEELHETHDVEPAEVQYLSQWEQIAPIWRSQLWLGVQALRRLGKRTASGMPLFSSLVLRIHPSQCGPSSISYALSLFRKYSTYLSGAALALGETTICEAGPGPSLGVSAMFALAGAKAVTAVDYELWASMDRTLAGLPDLAEALLSNAHWSPDEAEAILRRAREGDVRLAYERQSLESLALPRDSVDFLFSHAVLEHVGDLTAAFRSMARVLSPKGVAVHRVDLRDHGFMAKRNPWLMLQFPDWLWRACTDGAPGAITRNLFPDYVAAAQEAGLKVHISSLDRVQHFPIPLCRLAREFRHLPADVLAITGFEMVCSR